MSFLSLAIIVTSTWILWAFAAVYEHYVRKREGRVGPDNGISVAPVIPIFPIAFVGLAKLVDLGWSPWGSYSITAVHAALAILFACAVVYVLVRHVKLPPSE